MSLPFYQPTIVEEEEEEDELYRPGLGAAFNGNGILEDAEMFAEARRQDAIAQAERRERAATHKQTSNRGQPLPHSVRGSQENRDAPGAYSCKLPRHSFYALPAAMTDQPVIPGLSSAPASFVSGKLPSEGSDEMEGTPMDGSYALIIIYLFLLMLLRETGSRSCTK
jgi:hypothetical protein